MHANVTRVEQILKQCDTRPDTSHEEIVWDYNLHEAYLLHLQKITLGPLMEGPQCRLSLIRNVHVLTHYFSKIHVDFKSKKYNVICLYSPVSS